MSDEKKAPPQEAWPAAEFLKRGAAVLDARAAEYDSAGGERSAGKVAAMWSACTGVNMTEAQAWLFLVLLKAARLESAPGPHNDSATDGAAYFALMGESKGREGATLTAQGEVKAPGECGRPAAAEDRDIRAERLRAKVNEAERPARHTDTGDGVQWIKASKVIKRNGGSAALLNLLAELLREVTHPDEPSDGDATAVAVKIVREWKAANGQDGTRRKAERFAVSKDGGFNGPVYLTGEAGGVPVWAPYMEPGFLKPPLGFAFDDAKALAAKFDAEVVEYPPRIVTREEKLTNCLRRMVHSVADGTGTPEGLLSSLAEARDLLGVTER